MQVSSVWREVVRLVRDKEAVTVGLVQQVLTIGLARLAKVQDRGFLHKLHHLLEYIVTMAGPVRHSPLVWRWEHCLAQHGNIMITSLKATNLDHLCAAPQPVRLEDHPVQSDPGGGLVQGQYCGGVY